MNTDRVKSEVQKSEVNGRGGGRDAEVGGRGGRGTSGAKQLNY